MSHRATIKGGKYIMNVSENILDDKHFKFLKDLSEKTEAKRKYIKPLENLFSFFIGEKVKLIYKWGSPCEGTTRGKLKKNTSVSIVL